FNESNNFILRVYGSVSLNPNVIMNGELRLTGAEDGTFATNGSTQGTLEIRVQKTGPAEDIGTVTLLDNWSNPQGGRFVWLRGDVDVRDRTLDLIAFRGIQTLGGHLDMRDASITVNNWEFLSTSKT